MQTPSEELAYGPSESSEESSEEALDEEPINTKYAKGNHKAFAKPSAAHDDKECQAQRRARTARARAERARVTAAMARATTTSRHGAVALAPQIPPTT